MKSALFVDFDNVYTQLRQVQPAAAERFARQPIEWIRWLIESLEIPDGHNPEARRRLLVRRCYLNPNWYQTYRHAFLRAGFEIVDCPPVTSQGKTSTDIHMVLDIIDLLQQQETRYDEFIVMSADADFTPVLRKLRRHDRRTSVLAIGFPSAAYQASADLLIDERLFIEQALGLTAEPAEPPAATPAAAAPAAPAAPPAVAPAAAQFSAAPVGGAPAAEPDAMPLAGGAAVAPSAPLHTRSASDEELAQIARRIEQAVAQSAQPVPAGQLALRLRQEFAAVLENWNGHGTFKPFFRSLGLDRLVWITGSGGRLADPARHSIDLTGAAQPEAPADRESRWAGQEALLPVARDVCNLTGAPLLPPSVVRAVLDLLCEDLALQPYEPTLTARRICEQCQAQRGLEVAMRDVVFILRGMQLNGHVFGRGQDDTRTLAQRLINQVLFLCEREQMVLDPATVAQIRQWIGGDLAA